MHETAVSMKKMRDNSDLKISVNIEIFWSANYNPCPCVQNYHESFSVNWSSVVVQPN